jgi:TolB-like protein/class 3 adenylate cyclase/Tfp pilus assembly protein PilF
MERRLVALMAADVVDYSARMAAAEAATLAGLADLQIVLERRVAENGGRLFAAAGDGFLVEFASPVAAVRAAFEIQRDLSARRRREPETLELRIGVHLADVVVRGDNLLGDGVNVASRIEGVAMPGSVTVSQQIFDQVKRAALLTFENLGEHRLKNIPEPVRLYRVVGEQGAHSYISGTFDVTARTTDMPVPPLDRPSIVVLPFANMSGDPEQDYFADGLSEDLITDLARFRGLFVVSRNASFVYRGRDVDPRRAGREMGVRYCLEGSVRKLGDRVRITAQLVDAGGGDHVWADRFDAALHDLFGLQDEITARIVATIVGRVEARDAAVTRRKRPADLDAYDCLLRGLEYHRLGGVTREDAEQAVAWFERAIAKDSRFGRAHAWRACAIANRAQWRGINWWDDEADCIGIAERALELDENDAEVHRIMGEINLEFRNYARAEHHFLRAIELNPNHVYIVARTAQLYNMLGEPAKAMAMLDRAKSLDPFLPDYCREGEAVSHYLLERYAYVLEVNALFRRLSRRAAAYGAAAAVHGARAVETQNAAEELLRLDPQFRVGAFLKFEPYKDARCAERLGTDLRAAGLPP